MSQVRLLVSPFFKMSESIMGLTLTVHIPKTIHAGPGGTKIGPFQDVTPVACLISGNASEALQKLQNKKMADFVVQIHEVVMGIISTSRGSKKELNGNIGRELLELTRAVVKKHTLPAEKRYKYHLAQPARMLSRSVVLWNKSIVRKLRRKPNGSAPWTVKVTKEMPCEVYECFKAASLAEQAGGLLIKRTKHVEEIEFNNVSDLRNIFLEFANNHGKCLEEENVMFRKEKDDSHSIVIVNPNHPAIFHYSRRLEVMCFRCRYGHYNRFGVPQFSL